MEQREESYNNPTIAGSNPTTRTLPSSYFFFITFAQFSSAKLLPYVFYAFLWILHMGRKHLKLGKIIITFLALIPLKEDAVSRKRLLSV